MAAPTREFERQVKFWVTADQIARLRSAAALRGESPSALFRRALERELAQPSPNTKVGA